MGIENNTREIEVQNQELQRANREQIEQANKEHEELGKVLDGLDTLDNEAELDEISGNEDISEQDDAASQLDNNDEIEDETSEQFETINNPVYNEVENNGFSINDVNQAVDAKEAYEAEIRDMSQDEYHDQKELDQRVEENGSEPNMTEPSVLGNDLHQGDVSNKETDDRSRLNEPEQNAVDMERSTEETLSNDEIDDSLSDVSTVDETNIQEVKLSELPDNVQESYRKYESDPESDTENPEDKPEDENPESHFSKDNFKPEKSYDARCSQEFSDLKNKSVMPEVSMGETIDSSERVPKGEYTDKERSELRDARDAVESPKSDTVMQKVAAIDTGDIEKDLKSYLDPTVWDSDRGVDTGVSCDCKIYGFVSKAEDTTPFTTTPQECYDNLRLDYEGTKYTNPDQSVYVVRYTGDTGQYDIPYNKEFGGTRSDGQPFTGNGYTGSSKHVIPEYVSNGTTPSSGEIYRVNPDGLEEAVAYYNKKEKVFTLYD